MYCYYVSFVRFKCRLTVIQLLVFCRKAVDELKQHPLSKDSGKKEQSSSAATAKVIAEQLEIMEDVATALETGNDMMELANEIQPVRVLGFEAQYGTAFTIVTSVISFFLYISSVIFGFGN